MPLLFRHGTDCKLASLTQLENFPAYIRLKSENISGSILEELQQSQFVKRVYSASLIRYMRRYISLQSSVLLKEINLSSVIYLWKIIQRSVKIFKSAKRMLDFTLTPSQNILF